MTIVHIYVAEGFEEVEMISVVDVLRRAGVETRLVSLTEKLAVTGAHSITVQTEIPFSAATELADMIILPGGGPGTQNLLASTALHDRLHAHLASGKRVAAICAAPMVLAKAGILKGRNACCFPGCEAALIDGGATITAYNVVTDGQVTTSRGPGTAALFGLELAKLLVGDAKATEVGRAMLFI
ncbi:MAG: DJ-1/PfpI family protein [Formivibrio sp.]|nr:DJ-1/PfpI family protein [Formivibrio sp.]